MSLPRIRKDFKAVGHETPKAIQFVDFDGMAYWVPRSLCTLIKTKSDRVVVTIAAFKFEEITGIEAEPLTTTFASLGGNVLPHHASDCVLHASATIEFLPGQQRCVEAALKSRYMAFLCEAGTGKTLMSLTVANSRFCEGLIKHIIVLCPADLQEQWQTLSGVYFPGLKINVFSIHSASYEQSLERIKSFYSAQDGPIQLIVDESHLCRNQSAKRSRNIEKSFHAEFCCILTGFPIERNAGDLFYQFGIMSREILGCENYGQFQKNFLLLGGNDGEQVVAYQNTRELANRINPYIVRLTKKEVAPELPDKQFHDIYFDMSENQLKAYQAMNGLIASYGFLPKNKQYQLGTFCQKLANGYSPTDEELSGIFGNLGKLGSGSDNVARIATIAFDANNSRIQALKQLLETIPDQVIIWCNYTDEINTIAEMLPSCGVINGKATLRERNNLIAEFTACRLQYLVMSIAINEGFNLQCCHYEVFYSDQYSRTKAENAADRCHRIGQSETIHIYRFIARNSLDERIKKVRERKSKICDIFNEDSYSAGTQSE